MNYRILLIQELTGVFQKQVSVILLILNLKSNVIVIDTN